MPYGRNDANGQGNEQGDDGDAGHQDEGVGDAAADDGGDGLAASQCPRLAPVPAQHPAPTGLDAAGVCAVVGAACILAGGGLVVAPGAGFKHLFLWPWVADGIADFIQPIFAGHPGDVAQVEGHVQSQGGFDSGDVFGAEPVFGVGGQV